MIIKNKIVEQLKNQNLSINDLKFRIKESENSIRVVLNRDLKPNKIVLETNKFRNKYKIYTLNTPQRAYYYLGSLLMYYEPHQWMIYEEMIRSKTWVDFFNESIESWSELNKINGKLEKRIKIRKKQKARVEIYYQKSKYFYELYEKLYSNLRSIFHDIKDTRDNNNLKEDTQFEEILKVENDIISLSNEFVPWKNKVKKFYNKMKKPKK